MKPREKEHINLYTGALWTLAEHNFSENQHWAYLYIAMNDVVVMAVPQCFKDLSHVVTTKSERKRSETGHWMQLYTIASPDGKPYLR